MAKYGTGAVIVSVMVIALLGFLVWQGISGNVATEGTAKGCGDSTATLTFPVKNAYSASTSVSATPYGRVDGGDIINLSGQSLRVGAKISDVFYSASNYIDAKGEGFEVLCGQTLAPTGKLKPTDNPDTFYLATKTGTALTDSAVGGASNATATSGTLELQLNIGSSTDETTGDLVIVVEYDNSTQADSISLTGATKYSTPSGKQTDLYSAEASNSLIEMFEIPAIEDGDSKELILKIYPSSGKTLASSAIRVTRYSKQAFEDSTGDLIVNVVDSEGTSKSEDTGDYDGFVGSA